MSDKQRDYTHNSDILLILDAGRGMYLLYRSKSGLFMQEGGLRTEDDVCAVVATYSRCLALPFSAVPGIYLSIEGTKSLAFAAFNQALFALDQALKEEQLQAEKKETKYA